LYFFLNFEKIQRKYFDHFWVWNFPSRSRASRSGFYPAFAALKKLRLSRKASRRVKLNG
jgi:hypothetical protein